MLKVSAFTQISKEERVKMEVLLHQGWSFSAIALELHRSPSTISREVQRNGGRVYQATPAQAQAVRRHREKKKHTVFDAAMKAYICQKLLELKWSPELIAVMGKKECCPHFVCHEKIYQWIWQMKFSQKKADRPYQHLYEHLRHAHRRRKRSTGRHNRGNILERRWIEERPKGAENRKVAGHLEADIMLGENRQPGLLVVLDRKTRRTWIRKLQSKEASYVSGLLHSVFRSCGVVKTLTLDNDQSFAHHYELGIPTFFTHPYSSQEKGSVENRIGLIRMFFPKKTDFTKVTPQEVKKVEHIINHRPMRMFNYRSPHEIHKS